MLDVIINVPTFCDEQEGNNNDSKNNNINTNINTNTDANTKY